MPDIITMLKEDHAKVKKALAALVDEKKSDPSRRESAFAQVALDIRIHSEFEEDEIYPTLADNEETEDEAQEAMVEHDQIATLLEEIEDMEPGDELWRGSVARLLEKITHHVSEEEATLLPALSDLMDSEDLEQLGQQYEEKLHSSSESGGMDG